MLHGVVVIVMGAAGAGKTTVGRALATSVGWPFVEGDSYHSPGAVEKIRSGIGLTDTDRAPWLAALHGVIANTIGRREHRVVACSALRERYRETLRDGLRPVRFVFLNANEATLRRRLETRAGHFAGPSILRSQLAELEEPRDALAIDATKPLDEIVATVRYEFGL
jgi:gluconokinase